MAIDEAGNAGGKRRAPRAATPPKAPAPVPAPPRGDKTADPAVYLKRLDAAQASINRVFIAFIALFAFWLTIEINYPEFQGKLRAYAEYSARRDVALAQLSNLATKRNRTLNQAVAVAAPAAKTDSSASDADAGAEPAADPGNATAGAEESILKTIAALRSSQKKKNAEVTTLDKKIVELNAGTLDLSILGTKLPSTILFAAQLWLAALALAVMFLLNYRQSMFRNMTLLHGALGPDDDRFGVAGDGTPLLAPLPSTYIVELPNGPVVARGADLRNLLGWRLRTERYSSRLSLLFLFLLLCVAGRVSYLAFVTSGPIALDAGWISPAWHWFAFPLAMGLLAITAFVIAIILFPRAGEQAQIDAERRMAIGIGAAAALAALGGLFGPGLIGLLRDGTQKRPRNRPGRRHVFKRAFVQTDLGTGGFALSRKGRTVHWLEAGGYVRLWGTPAKKVAFGRVHLVRPPPPAKSGSNVTGIEVRENAAADSPKRTVTGGTRAFEPMALAMLARDEVADAMDCLLFACQFDLRKVGEGIDLRLFDLLRGLMVRFADRPETQHRVEIFRTMLNGALERTVYLLAIDIKKPRHSFPANDPSANRSNRRLAHHRRRLQEIYTDLGTTIPTGDNAPRRFRKWQLPTGRRWQLPKAHRRSTDYTVIASKSD
jgi:hypothetical protein